MAAATENTDLPRALISTIIKNKLASSAPADDPDKQAKVNLNKDALLAFVESAKIFISYLTATANDICHESKRQIINVDDVFNALEDIEFGEFVAPLKEAIEAFREESKEKNAKKAERTKKRKQEEAEAAQAEAELDTEAGPPGHTPENNLAQQSVAGGGELGGPQEEVEPVDAIGREEVQAGMPIEPVPAPVLPQPHAQAPTFTSTLAPTHPEESLSPVLAHPGPVPMETE